MSWSPCRRNPAPAEVLKPRARQGRAREDEQWTTRARQENDTQITPASRTERTRTDARRSQKACEHYPGSHASQVRATHECRHQDLICAEVVERRPSEPRAEVLNPHIAEPRAHMGFGRTHLEPRVCIGFEKRDGKGNDRQGWGEHERRDKQRIERNGKRKHCNSGTNCNHMNDKLATCSGT